MKNLSKSEKLLLSIFAIMLIGYIYYQYIITPIGIKTKAVQDRVNNYEQKVLQAKFMDTSNKKMNEEIVSLKEKYDKYIKLMPKSDMNAEVMRELNKLALENKVTLVGLTMGNGVKYEAGEGTLKNTPTTSNQAGSEQKKETQASGISIMAVPVIINIKGDYSGFTEYINNLETNSRLTNVSAVNVTKQGNVDGQLSVTLTASVLYVQDGINLHNEYDFNQSSYGKDNPFK
ncbi:hypothetical protein NBE98_20590 [Clostridium swellfunianum]|uniref:hypothetical protein n=1 Tax=Clostridium swellfunianum TaxID=1367462 RepID=UPI00202F577A|nr:hypothetical protein [Clostridium swellfunianum]MCM0650756.1 hypothetical protein [Clostridium swellfunianum]